MTQFASAGAAGVVGRTKMTDTPEIVGNTLWTNEIRAELLHILPQTIYHGQAEIRGSSAALRRLGEALIRASRLKQTETEEVSMMAADGEGYAVIIRPMSDKQMDAGPLPYAQLGLPWDSDADEIARLRAELAAERAARGELPPSVEQLAISTLVPHQIEGPR